MILEGGSFDSYDPPGSTPGYRRNSDGIIYLDWEAIEQRYLNFKIMPTPDMYICCVCMNIIICRLHMHLWMLHSHTRFTSVSACTYMRVYIFYIHIIYGYKPIPYLSIDVRTIKQKFIVRLSILIRILDAVAKLACIFGSIINFYMLLVLIIVFEGNYSTFGGFSYNLKNLYVQN